MSIFDKLLEVDATKLAKKEKKELEIKRLSAIFGEPFIVTVSAMTGEQFSHVMESTKDSEYKEGIILEGCRVEGKKFSDKAFLDKFGEQKGINVVKRLFRAGEINNLYGQISYLSGYGNDAVAEVKN